MKPFTLVSFPYPTPGNANPAPDVTLHASQEEYETLVRPDAGEYAGHVAIHPTGVVCWYNVAGQLLRSMGF